MKYINRGKTCVILPVYFKSYRELKLFKNSLPVKQPCSKAHDQGLNKGKLVQSVFLYDILWLKMSGKKEKLVNSFSLSVMK